MWRSERKQRTKRLAHPLHYGVKELMSLSNVKKQSQYLAEEDVMKRIISVTLTIAIVALLSALIGQEAYTQSATPRTGTGHQYGPFDADGDGIPNGLDPDFVKPKDGSGQKFGKAGQGANAGSYRHMVQSRIRSESKGLSLRNGSGPNAGKGTGQNGVCDGTGPKGKNK